MDKINEKLKEILNKDKKTSNLILIIILLVILLIAVNYIFNKDKKSTKQNVETVSNNVNQNKSTDIETKLENILGKINGIEGASVMLTYSTTEKVIPVYDVKENVDIEEEKDSTNKKTTTEKTVAYEDTEAGKTAIVESKETAVANGAIVVAKGNITENLKSQIKEAVSAITNIPIHKIQVFEN